MNGIDAARSAAAAIVVTYRPEADRLLALLRALQPQVASVVVVDNGDGVVVRQWVASMPGITLVTMGHNRGIAAAQNAGIEAATRARTTAAFLVFFDQDSLPAGDCVQRLLEAAKDAADRGERVGAVGAATTHEGREEGFVRVGRWGYEAITPTQPTPWIRCDQVISSGCLIPAAALRAVGGMNETLFIDKVDSEWCLRARSLSYSILGAPAAKLAHRLGGGQRRHIWLLRWRSVPIHDPVRYYYMFRNSVLVQRMPHAHWRWIVAEWGYNLKLLVGIGLTLIGGRGALAAMIRGVFDGLRGVSGERRQPQ